MEGMVPQPELNAQPAPELPKVPGYRVEKVIGRGATGVVYRAVQLAVDRPVALKILHRELVGTKRAVRRLQREARTAARLTHPAIISAIDMGEVDGQWWFAMELVEGVSLAQRLRDEGSLSEREVLRLFLPLCEGLQHAFDKGVVHRDVKPANILVDERGRARIVDLGLAFAESDPMLTSSGGTLGTPHYISPEQARDPTSADTRSDIWSLGATLFHALCGRPPFDGESVAEILSSVLYRPIQDPRELAPELSKGMALVLRKCLARDPARRYQTPAELAIDLELLRERRAPRVRSRSLDPLASDAPRWLRPASWSAGALAAIGLVWFLLARDGREIDPRGAVIPGDAPSWPELEDLERRVQEGDVSLADAIRGLQAMQIPGDLTSMRVRHNELLSERTGRLRAVLTEFWLPAKIRLDEALAQKDYDGALAWAREGSRAELERLTGYADPKDLPEDMRMSRDARGFDTFEQIVLGKRREAVANARADLLQYVTGVIVPEVGRNGEHKRWRTASARLDGGVEQWFADHADDVRGLNEAERAEIALAAAPKLDEARARIVTEVEQASGKLLLEIPALERDFEEDLRKGGRSVGARLREAFQAQLERHCIDRAELPEAAAFPAFERLEERAAGLEAAELAQIRADARMYFTQSEAEVRELMRTRRYAEAAAFWRERLEFEWLVLERERIELRVRECELLQEVLDAAAARVVELDGKVRTFYHSRSIRESGTIVAGSDPHKRGFEQRISAALSHRYHLAVPKEGLSDDDAVVVPADLELLAGPTLDLLTGPTEPPTPENRLKQALLRFHEGEYAAAKNGFPASFPADPLYEDVRLRIEEANREKTTAIEQRLEELAFCLRMIERHRRAGATDAAIRETKRALDGYSDLLDEQESARLRDLLETLKQGGARPSLEDAYAPDELERGQLIGEFRMSWRFDDDPAHAWRKGAAWISDGNGWSPLQPLASDQELFAEDSGVGLELGPPIDLEHELKLRLRLEPRDAEEQKQTLVLTLAGFHVAIVVDGTKGYWLLDTADDPRQILHRLRTEPSSRTPFNYDSAKPFEVELVVHPKLGQAVSVSIAETTTRPPSVVPPRTADPRIVLRVLERMSLVAAELEGTER